MKVCPNCHLTYSDEANVCGQCGTTLVYVSDEAVRAQNIFDHTAEFDPEDISRNKILAMIPYLFGWAGIIITLLASASSPYAAFHVRQALKIQVVTILFTFLGLIPILGWIAAVVWAFIAFVIEIIQFVSVCRGEAKEPPIIKNFGFLR